MDEFIATELAYKNGYKKGHADGTKEAVVNLLNTAIRLSNMCETCYEYQNRLIDLVSTLYDIKIDRKTIIEEG